MLDGQTLLLPDRVGGQADETPVARHKGGQPRTKRPLLGTPCVSGRSLVPTLPLQPTPGAGRADLSACGKRDPANRSSSRACWPTCGSGGHRSTAIRPRPRHQARLSRRHGCELQGAPDGPYGCCRLLPPAGRPCRRLKSPAGSALAGAQRLPGQGGREGQADGPRSGTIAGPSRTDADRPGLLAAAQPCTRASFARLPCAGDGPDRPRLSAAHMSLCGGQCPPRHPRSAHPFRSTPACSSPRTSRATSRTCRPT